MPRITKKGQVTIPKEIREALGLKRGDSVEFVLQEGRCILVKKREINLKRWIGALGKGDTDEFIRQIRGEG